MNTKFVAALAVCATFAVTPALAEEKAPEPKASKAEVQKLLDDIKADKAKLKQYCDLSNLQDQYEAAAKKADEKKLDAIDKEMEEGAKKMGADFERIMQQLDDETSALAYDLAKSCGK
ncbi:MAG TPA: hypothetical protein VNR65_08310 [Geobacterales bacterium]|nr:hypothetical protein [Geobacterales bacterium]